jgi:hypothetical protein
MLRRLWYGNRDFAVTYRAWAAREKARAEIRVYGARALQAWN